MIFAPAASKEQFSTQSKPLRPSFTFRFPVLLALFIAELLILFVTFLPRMLSFSVFANGDSGSNLKSTLLLAQGLRPTIDFSYTYGLLSLTIERVVFSVFGVKPWVFAALNFIYCLCVVVALVRVLVHLNPNWKLVVFLAAIFPHVVAVLPPHLTQALEAALLSNAIASHICKQRKFALSLTVLCIFVKSTMAGLFLLIQLAILIMELANVDKSQWLSTVRRRLMPALVTGIVTTILLLVLYGPTPLFRTLFPLDIAKHYEAVHMGFFRGIGQPFWWPDKVNLNYYIGSAAGFWLGSTAFIVFLAIYFLVKPNYRSATTELRLVPPADLVEPFVILALLQILFICFLFGHWYHYTSYPYLLGMGLLWSFHWKPMRSWLWVLVLFAALLGQKATMMSNVTAWRTTHRSVATYGLWASPEKQNEWVEVKNALHGEQAMVLSGRGAPGILDSQLESTEMWYYMPGAINTLEVQKVRDQLKKNRHVIVFTDDFGWLDPRKAPEFSDIVDEFHATYNGKFIQLLER
jgi:hypothetical protein